MPARPDLEGTVLRHPNGLIALVVDGTWRGFPNLETFRNICGFTAPTPFDLDTFDSGPGFPDGAHLLRPSDGPTIWMMINNDQNVIIRRGVTSLAALSKYNLAGTAQIVPPAVIAAIPEGPVLVA